MGHCLLAQPGDEFGPKSAAILAAPEFRRDHRVAKSLGLTTEAFYALSEDEQNLQIEAWQQEQREAAERCDSHGGSRNDCADPDRDWFPQRTVCRAEMQRAAADRKYDALHKAAPYHDGSFGSWSKEPDAAHPFHFRDGVTIWVAPVDVDPDNGFLEGR